MNGITKEARFNAADWCFTHSVKNLLLMRKLIRRCFGGPIDAYKYLLEARSNCQFQSTKLRNLRNLEWKLVLDLELGHSKFFFLFLFVPLQLELLVSSKSDQWGHFKKKIMKDFGLCFLELKF